MVGPPFSNLGAFSGNLAIFFNGADFYPTEDAALYRFGLYCGRREISKLATGKCELMLFTCNHMGIKGCAITVFRYT